MFGRTWSKHRTLLARGSKDICSKRCTNTKCASNLVRMCTGIFLCSTQNWMWFVNLSSGMLPILFSNMNGVFEIRLSWVQSGPRLKAWVTDSDTISVNVKKFYFYVWRWDKEIPFCLPTSAFVYLASNSNESFILKVYAQTIAQSRNAYRLTHLAWCHPPPADLSFTISHALWHDMLLEITLAFCENSFEWKKLKSWNFLRKLFSEFSDDLNNFIQDSGFCLN